MARATNVHTGYVLVLTLSTDGQTLYSGSADRTIKQWSVAQQRCLQTFRGHQNGVMALALAEHGGGQVLYSGSGDNTIKEWSVTTGQCLRTFLGHLDGVWVLALSADGTTLYSGSEDLLIKHWDLSTGEVVRTLRGHTRALTGLVLSGNSLISSSADGTLRAWDYSSDATNCAGLQLWSGPEGVGAMVRSADGLTVFAGWNNGVIAQICIATTTRVRGFTHGHYVHIRALALSADGSTLCSGDSGRTIKQWSVSSGRCLRTWQEHMGPIRSFALSRSGETLFSATAHSIYPYEVWSVPQLMHIAQLPVDLARTIVHGGTYGEVQTNHPADSLIGDCSDEEATSLLALRGQPIMLWSDRENNVDNSNNVDHNHDVKDDPSADDPQDVDTNPADTNQADIHQEDIHQDDLQGRVIETIILPRYQAYRSRLVAVATADDPEIYEIPVMVPSDVLRHVLRYLQFSWPVSPPTFYNWFHQLAWPHQRSIFLAANYLDIPELFAACVDFIRSLVGSYTPTELRSRLQSFSR
jgi:WD40 repeat protein